MKHRYESFYDPEDHRNRYLLYRHYSKENRRYFPAKGIESLYSISLRLAHVSTSNRNRVYDQEEERSLSFPLVREPSIKSIVR